ncbi:MAG: polyprenyl diphosphate synthase [Mariprofundaceae bacterium]
MAGSAPPRHVGIIMDGNGRWAQSRGLPRLEGHRRGARVARDVVRWARDAGVRQISLYAFSTENWQRPANEVRSLMSMLATLLPRELPDMMRHGVRFRALGDLSALPSRARRAVDRASRETKNNRNIDLILCLNYGGQQEILAGIRPLAERADDLDALRARLAAMTPTHFRDCLWRAPLHPVDLIIRTGGERRISNFHLWDAAYAELYFTDVFWPDFTEADLLDALKDYAARERRFGRVPADRG